MRFLAIALAAAALASAASAATPKSWYWSTARAATLVKAKVKIPCAKLTPNPNHLPPAAICATQPPSSIAGATVTCAGQGTPLKGTRRYTRFVCRWSTVNQTSYGSLMVYVAGVSSLRWKVV